MGYTTDFHGQFDLDRPLTLEHAAYLRKFAQTRRMKRDAAKTELRDDPIRKAVGLPVGPEGAYFVGEEGYYGQSTRPDVVDRNDPPEGQPDLWCQWVPTEDLEGIEWDGGEKFYEYVEWLEYIIEHFLRPWGYVLNGSVKWQGESFDDRGLIVVKKNDVGVTEADYEGDVHQCPECGHEGPPEQLRTD
jgi:hypothetical protein